MTTLISRLSRTPTTLTSTSQKVSTREQPLCLKLVVRLLPPLLTKDEFFKQVSEFYPDNKIIGDYYVQGHLPENPYEQQTYSRAYVLFKVHDDVQEFVLLVSGKPFFEPDAEDPFTPLIEKSLINRLPGKAPVSKKSESKIENQETYKRFLAFLEGKNGATEYSFLEVLKDVRKEKRRKHKALVDVSTSDRKSTKKGKEEKGKHVEDESKTLSSKKISKKDGKERVKNKNKENKRKENKNKSKDQKDESNSPNGQHNAADNEKTKHKSEGTPSESQLSILKDRVKDSKLSKQSSNLAGPASSNVQDSSKRVETSENDQGKKSQKLSSDKSQVPKLKDIKSKKAPKLKEDKSKVRDVSDSNSNNPSKHTETLANEESSTPTKRKGSKKNKSKGLVKQKGTESKSLQCELKDDSANSELQSPGSKNNFSSAEVPSESQQITDKSDNKSALNQKEVSSQSSKVSKRIGSAHNSKSLLKQKHPDSSSNPKVPTLDESGNKNVHELLDTSMDNTQEKKSEITGKRKRKPRSRKKSDKSDTSDQHEAKEAV
jgi:regulator of nonsense transcripts 3